MPTTVAAMRGRLGDTDYYVLAMKAGELVNKVKIPKEIPGWAALSVEERYQRDINYNRVKNHIAPYLANEQSRFFGAVIVTAMNFSDAVTFEPLPEMTKKGLPALYRTAAEGMGFLTFTGGEVLVPLDGQHRLKAIDFAITGLDEKSQAIRNVQTPNTALAEEDVTVILVPFERQKARRIFTKVNRYAKATTTGQNIVTSDDDMIAVLTREIANDFMGGRLAKFTSNTLTKKDAEFTTLAIIYNVNREIIVRYFFARGKLDTSRLPARPERDLWRMKVREIWKVVLEGIDVFADALTDVGKEGDARRQEIRRENLLGRPVAQECLIGAYLRLIDAPTGLRPEDACKALNGLPWRVTQENLGVWDQVLWTGGVEDGRMVTKHRGLVTRLAAYLAGEKLSSDAQKELLDDYLRMFPEAAREGRQLPERPSR